MSKLVIVESPSKAKTIKKYLGSGYEVIASMGHVRDLPKARLSVDVKNNFEPKYDIMPDKKKIVAELKEKASKSEFVYLATDPDREGEAISWHLKYILSLPDNVKNRVEFNEITKSGIESGMNNPREINMDLFYAQQARRILDRLVGYRLSPFISQKIHRGLSAGRVQSVTLRIIVDRENEIRNFKPVEYWSIDAKFSPKGAATKTFEASLYAKDNKKLAIKNKEQVDEILKDLDGGEYTVQKLTKGVRKKQPAPPFITSTLQQEASRKLGFRSARTMKVAQELYEGVEIPNLGLTGLITYMRTDSLRISDEAYMNAKNYIESKWGEKYNSKTRRVYKTKANVQDGHEAIRPSSISIEPEQIKGSLTSDQYRLYKLIWERFIASQMADALHNTTTALIDCNSYTFKATGYTVGFDGFTVLYVEGNDEENEAKAKKLPDLNEGMILNLKTINPNQHFTQPPARFTEASLIKALEENGIGRPSTYAAIISTITTRNYVKRESKTLIPTELGEVITDLMKKRFPKIVNVKFTAEMEDSLDNVEQGDVEWVELLDLFYNDLEETLKVAKEAMKGEKITLKEDEIDIDCDKCGKKMVVKYGPYGKFIACSGWPECKNILKITKTIDVKCPKCGNDIIVKRSKRGKVFYGCKNYPDCDFVSWNEPTNEVCPKCSKMLFKSKGKKSYLYCEDKDCGYKKTGEE